MPRALVPVLALTLLLAACTQQPPEVSVNDQVPADMRTEEGAEGAEGGETGQQGAETGETFEFVSVDIDYTEAPEQIPAGTVTFHLTNEGSAPHNVVIEEIGDEIVVAANGGNEASGTVRLEPGAYTYYCSIPGHRAAGMEGTLEVA